ncbi:MAG: radical SAM protein [Paludibacter sp.]|nr:radical SAM protein [Paludibacter sp.]
MVSHTNTTPFFISIEPDNFCQLKCPECPVSLKKNSPKHYLANENLIKIIDDLKSTLVHVIFYFQGEPLLNPDLPKMIAYTHKNNIYTSLSTNAQALTRKKAEELVRSGLDKIIISIDGTTQDIYEKYRRGGNLDKAIEGIKHLTELRKQLASRSPLIEIQFVVFKINEHQISEIKKLAKTLKVDRLSLKTAQLYNFEHGHELMTSIDKFSRYKRLSNGKYAIKNKMQNRCQRLWNGAVITAEGNVLPCCFDKDQKYTFGNLNSNNFQTIWHNKKASGFRASILQNRKQYDMCRNCTSK